MEKKEKDTQSLYIETELWLEAKKAAKATDSDISTIISRLLRMWLARQVTVTLEPKETIL